MDKSEVEQAVRCFSWKDLTLAMQPVDIWGRRKEGGASRAVVDGVSCHVTAGSVVALVGGAGCGKLVLLKALARRHRPGTVQGRVYVNGADVSDEMFDAISAYVPAGGEEDVFPATATPREALMLVASLKLPPTMPAEERRRRVKEVAQAAGLRHRLDHNLGGTVQGGHALHGLGLGDRRRLALAARQLMGASLLFLEDPTSRLSPFEALQLMETLSSGARANQQIVLCTINQADRGVWQHFTHTLVLGSGGKQVYYGETAGVVPWLVKTLPPPMMPRPPSDSEADSEGHVILRLPPSPDRHPSGDDGGLLSQYEAGQLSDLEFILKALTCLALDVNVRSAQVSETFKVSERYRDIIDRIEAEVDQANGRPPLTAHKPRASWLTACLLLLGHNGRVYARNPGFLATRLLTILVVASLVGVSLKGVADWPKRAATMGGPAAQQAVVVSMQRVAASFLLTSATLLLLPLLSIPIFIYASESFSRQSRLKLYPPSACILATAVLEVAVNCFTGLLFGLIVYFPARYGTAGPAHSATDGRATHALTYLALTMLMSNAGYAQSIMLTLLSPNASTAFSLNCAFVTLAIVTSGLLVPQQDLAHNSRLLAGLSYVTPLGYAWRALAANEFANAPSVLSSLQLPDLDLRADSGALVALALASAIVGAGMAYRALTGRKQRGDAFSLC